jgi:hypothetical protein
MKVGKRLTKCSNRSHRSDTPVSIGVRLQSRPMRFILLSLLLVNSNLCFAADWRASINQKLDALAVQLSDGCSTEVREARKIHDLKGGDKHLFAALVSIEGQHCGNGNLEYLVVYELGYTRPRNENDTSRDAYGLVAVETIGGRGERVVDFESLKYSEGVFTLSALAYSNDALCCPSIPIVVRYDLTFFGLNQLQSNKALQRTPSKQGASER